MKINTTLIFCFFVHFVNSQSYAPLPGEVGSTAIHKDSSAIIAWATGASVVRGPVNITTPSDGVATYGSESDAIGPATGTNVVSLGDGGSATVTFLTPISNVAGYDFAVFENGFTDNYIELAFVEVSSDGINFTRFDAVSEAPISPQYWNGSYSDCRYFNNLAGKYRANYGTPFDLDELAGVAGLDINAITHIRIVDVVGSVDPAYGTYDSQGTIINDPFPTPFESGGFDLDAVAVLNGASNSLINKNAVNISIYPNPTKGIVNIDLNGSGSYLVYNTLGTVLIQGDFTNSFDIQLNSFPEGTYILKLVSESGIVVKRLNLQL